MKNRLLAFTTLGCPQWDMDTIIARARQYGYDGVDFRGFQGELDLGLFPEFTSDIHDLALRFQDASLSIPCLSTSIIANTPDTAETQKNISETEKYCRMAARLHTPFIRIFIGRLKNQTLDQAIPTVVLNLKAIAELGKDHGVTILIETHDDWIQSEVIRRVMEEVGHPNLGIVWDLLNLYSVTHEAPEQTWSQIGSWVKNTHWKDSVGMGSEFKYCLFGQGDFPIQKFDAFLQKNGYSGYYTLEWEKRWHPEIEEPELAFPAFSVKIQGLPSYKSK